ncbi:MAG: hypothetical protein KF789_02670 [Bdellovibrionaceae bacterium]|nr:hypothetical protein [Pseudobdellovibrionaceae bacterium]
MTILRWAFQTATIYASLMLIPFNASAEQTGFSCQQMLKNIGYYGGAFSAGGIGLTSFLGEKGGEFIAGYACGADPDAPPPASCQTNPNSEQCRKDREQQAQQGPPQCLVATRAYAQACAASHGTASTSCSDSQMPRSNQSSQQTSDAIQNSENFNDTCRQVRGFNETFQQELQQFAASCESAVTQCANACQQMQNSAAGCSSAEAQRIAAQYQSQNTSCQSGGTLASRPSQARGEATKAKETMNQSAACAKSSQAAQVAQNSPASNLNNPSIDTSGDAPASSQDRNVASTTKDYQLAIPDSSTPKVGVGANRTDTTGAIASDVTDTTGDMPANHWGTDGSLASLPTTPSRRPAADDSENPNNLEQTVSADAASGTYGGGKGRAYRALARPVKAAGMMDESEDKDAKLTSAEDVPDLNQFRPTGMTGLVRCADGVSAASLPKTSGGTPVQCVHSPYKDLFKAVRECYEREVQDQKLYYDL